MKKIISNLENGTINISDEFDINVGENEMYATPYFNEVGSEYIISFINLENVKQLTNFSYDTLGMTDNRFLNNYYRISRDGESWTEWFDLKRNIDNFPPVDPRDSLFLDIKWVRDGLSETGTIRLLEYSIDGITERNIPESIGETTINIDSNETIIWNTPYIYKVFKINDIEIISNSDLSNIDIKYRFSQDNSRTWSEWEPFTKENITTVRINPIRFFQIEYSITNNSNINIGIQDINLIGDFQNVSQDYLKTNLYGIRECCRSNVNGYYDANGNLVYPDNSSVSASGGAASSLSSGGCNIGSGSTLPQMSSQDKANLYNPYNQTTAMDLLNKLSADAEQMFGFNVVYFCTDPDKKGQDHTIHEYQLYNIVCEGNIKAAVDGNNFPDSQIVMNQFDLSLFESMTVHITKKQFKEVFGPQRRPSKEDFLFFCDINRMFYVDHAQQFRNFNNSAIYYKLILKKYTQKANVKADNDEIKEKIKMLTSNSTIDELFGVENSQDKAAIANKQQFTTLTKDPIRLEYNVEINKELIENSSTIISKSYYELSTINYQSTAVKYKNLDPVLKVSDNIGYMSWFNINNYVDGEFYNFINYYDETNSIGYKINLKNDRLNVLLNNNEYTFNLNNSIGTSALEEDVWYSLVVNIDQRNRELSYYIYSRNTDDEDESPLLSNTLLRKIYSGSIEISPINYEFNNDIFCEIKGSDMKMTNIRVFIEIIPEDQHNKILNQYIIRDDSKYLVFADNATSKLVLPRFPLFE